MKFKTTIITLALLSTTFLFAEPVLEEQNSRVNTVEVPVVKKTPLNTAKIKHLLIDKENIEKELIEDNIWSKIYSNYHTYKVLKREKRSLDAQIGLLEESKLLTTDQKETLEVRQADRKTLVGKLDLLKEYGPSLRIHVPHLFRINVTGLFVIDFQNKGIYKLPLNTPEQSHSLFTFKDI